MMQRAAENALICIKQQPETWRQSLYSFFDRDPANRYRSRG
jgi:hypothetical protein